MFSSASIHDLALSSILYDHLALSLMFSSTSIHRERFFGFSSTHAPLAQTDIQNSVQFNMNVEIQNISQGKW